MDNPINHVAQEQRRALGFMLDALGLCHARDEVVRRDRFAELDGTMTALRAENRALLVEVSKLERQLYLLESEIAAFEREMDGRVALARPRASTDEI